MAKGFMNKKSIAYLSKLILVISFEFICMTIMAFGIQDKTRYVIFGGGAAILLVLMAGLLPEKISKKQEIFVVTGLTLICLIEKFAVANIFHPAPVADYKTYYETAQYLMQDYHYTVNPLYIALFPHVLGYAECLSILFQVFGTGVGTAVMWNVILSVISMLCLYKIGKSVGGFPMAVIISFLWIVFPSQSFWNSFVLSEPLYTTQLLLFWCLFLLAEERQENKKLSVFIALGAGMVLVLCQMVRTVGIIVIIAILITLFLVGLASVTRKRTLWVLLMVAVFLVGNQIANMHVESRIQTATGGFSWYHVCVGLEESTAGKWNEEDWNRVLENVNRFQAQGYEKPAVEAQKQEKIKAQEKIRNVAHPFWLLKEKMKILLGNDSSGIIIHLKYSGVSLKNATCEKIEFLTNSFYYMMVLLSLVGGILFLKDKSRASIAFWFLYAIGLTIGHMLLEVQERYHYSILIAFLVGTAYTVTTLTKSFANRKKI